MLSYGSCKCGMTEWMGSVAPSLCVECKVCGTGPAGREPGGHEWQKRYDRDTGETIMECFACMLEMRGPEAVIKDVSRRRRTAMTILADR